MLESTLFLLHAELIFYLISFLLLIMEGTCEEIYLFVFIDRFTLSVEQIVRDNSTSRFLCMSIGSFNLSLND